MSWTIKEIVDEIEYVKLDNGDICFVNGYMLENREKKRFYPITVYFKDVVSVVKYRN